MEFEIISKNEVLDKIIGNMKNIISNNINKSQNDLKSIKHDNLYEFIDDFIQIKESNINISLEIISNVEYISSSKVIVDYYKWYLKKNINLNFEDIPFWLIINKYIELVNCIYEPVGKYIFFNNIGFSDLKDLDINENLRIIDVLKIRKKQLYMDIPLFDIYLKEFKNAPESRVSVINYIFFLRRFPLFKNLVNNYFNIHKKDIFNKIKEIDNVDGNSIYIPLFMSFKTKSFIIENVLSFNSGKIDINNMYYNINSPHIKKDNFIKTFKKINMENLGFTKLIINPKSECYMLVKPSIFTQEFTSKKKDIDNIFIFIVYMKFINTTNWFLDNQENDESLNIFMSNFMTKCFFIYNYMNLQKYNLDEMLDIFIYHDLNIDLYTNLDPNMNEDYFEVTHSLVLIHMSYLLFKNDSFNINSMSRNIDILGHFSYVFKYFKTIEKNIFPLFVFLAFSNKEIKFLYEYVNKNNKILSFLNDFYDEIYKKSSVTYMLVKN